MYVCMYVCMYVFLCSVCVVRCTLPMHFPPVLYLTHASLLVAAYPKGLGSYFKNGVVARFSPKHSLTLPRSPAQ